MPRASLRTDRLLLRPAASGDLEGLHAIFSNPRAMRYWSTPPHADKVTTANWLCDMITAPADAEDYLIETLARPGHVIGKAGCWRPHEVGMLLHPDVWGMGFATEALRAILPRAFAAKPGLPEIVADIDPRNTGSARVLHKLGFLETGRAPRTYCISGEWSDSQYFALRRP